MRMIDHPNLVKLYDIFDIDNHLVLVMELMDGENLSRKISKGPIAEQDALKVLYGILKALQYLHQLKITHRDLKPANIMFKKLISQESGLETDYDLLELKLIDFGLCADVTDHSPNSLLLDKSGTVGYLAPELITNRKGE